MKMITLVNGQKISREDLAKIHEKNITTYILNKHALHNQSSINKNIEQELSILEEYCHLEFNYWSPEISASELNK